MADNPLFDPTPMGPPTGITRGKAVGPPVKPATFVKPGPVHKVVHYKDVLKCNHGGTVVLEPTEDRNTEIKADLRIVTDVDLLDRVTIAGCSLGCTKIVDIPVGRSRDVELRGGAIPVLSNLAATTNKGCTVKFVGDALDIDKAVAKLNRDAHGTSIHRCAAYVKAALHEGGLPYLPAASAYQLDGELQGAGFSSVATNGSAGYTPQAGDVVVFPAVGTHTDGHTAMYNGDQWVSDFRQNNMAVWRDQPNPRYTIFRSSGSSSGNGSGHQAHAGPR